MERDYKYTLGENIKNESTAHIVLIYKANASFDKVEILSKAKEKWKSLDCY